MKAAGETGGKCITQTIFSKHIFGKLSSMIFQGNRVSTVAFSKSSAPIYNYNEINLRLLLIWLLLIIRSLRRLSVTCMENICCIHRYLGYHYQYCLRVTLWWKNPLPLVKRGRHLRNFAILFHFSICLLFDIPRVIVVNRWILTTTRSSLL